VRLSYDAEEDAAYLRLVEPGHGNAVTQVVVDDEDLHRPIIIDLDAEGHVTGFEFLQASEILPATVLDEFR
jgi:uncharacterized protein YuzE